MMKKKIAFIKKTDKEDLSALIEDYARNSATEIMARYRKPKGYKIKYIATVCRNQCFHNIENEKERQNRQNARFNLYYCNIER